MNIKRVNDMIPVYGNRMFIRIPIIPGSVSYTHLDVYKRQVLQNMSIYIMPGSLFAGNQASKPRWAPIFLSLIHISAVIRLMSAIIIRITQSTKSAAAPM